MAQSASSPSERKTKLSKKHLEITVLSLDVIDKSRLLHKSPFPFLKKKYQIFLSRIS